MKSDFDAALDSCLEELAAGTNLDACLDRYPDHAAELKPLLQLAIDLRHVATPSASPSARAAGQQRMLAALSARPRPRSPLARFWERSVAAVRTSAWRPAVVAILVILVAAAGLALAASTTALPGDPLYAVKLARQDIQLALTLDPAREEMLGRQFATDRRRDVYSALALGRSAPVHFEGILESMDGDRWLVSSLPVAISPATRVHGEPAPGVPIDIRGRTSAAGHVVAISIDVDSDHAPWPAPTHTPSPTHTPTAMPTLTPTDMRVPTQTPTRTPPPSPMLEVTVEATSSVSPTATSRPPTPEPTATPEPTEPVAPPAASSPTPTPHLSATPTPTDIPLPSVTPTPHLSATPTPADTPSPSATPTPHLSATPTATDIPPPSPTLAPSPTATPRPTTTQEPTDTPKPTETPKPTSTPEPGDDDDASGRLDRRGATCT